MSQLVMKVNSDMYFAEPDNNRLEFYKHDGKRKRFVATIIDFENGFSFCSEGIFGFRTKMLTNEIPWLNTTDDEEGQLDVITKHGRKMIVRFPEDKTNQDTFIIGYSDGIEIKIIAVAKVIGSNLRFRFDIKQEEF